MVRVAIDKAGAAMAAKPKRRWGYNGSALLYLIPITVFVAVFSLVPVVELIRMSLSNVGVDNLIGRWPWVGLQNFVGLLESPGFRYSFEISLLYTAVILFLDLAVGLAASLFLMNVPRLAVVSESVMILGWALPPVVTASVWKFLLQDNGLINQVLSHLGFAAVPWLDGAQLALWMAILVTAWSSIPFATMVIKSSMTSIPAELIEAATLDGCGFFGIVKDIIIPQLKTTLVTLSVLVIVYGFGNSFSYIYVLTSGGPGTATTTLPYLGYVDAFSNFQFGSGAAVAVISMLLVGILTVVYVRVNRPASGS